MSYARTPALKKVPMTIWSEIHDVGTGRFSCRLCAPKRPPRCANAACGGAGKVLIGTGLLSTRASSTHTSLGQSNPSFLMHSSLTTSKLRSNSGNTVCVKPLNGGEFCQRLTSLGCALSAMSRITAPPSI
jgi:hypothetical protein